MVIVSRLDVTLGLPLERTGVLCVLMAKAVVAVGTPWEGLSDKVAAQPLDSPPIDLPTVPEIIP